MQRTRVHTPNPTRDDVAKAANISGATVSRVLSGRTDFPIAPVTRKRVLAAAKKLGYRPNAAARALMKGRSGLIGFWMDLQYSRYRGQVLDRMRTLLSGTDLTMAVTDIDETYNVNHSFDRALRVPIDGIIAFDNSGSIDAFSLEYEHLALGTPFVSMGAYWSEVQSYVGVDLAAGMESAIDHLLETRRTRIAYLAPWNSNLLTYGPRYETYARKMEENGLVIQTISVEDSCLTSLKQGLALLLETGCLPQAILCLNDDLAISLSFALTSFGLQPGKDVAIVGFDGISETEQCPVPITTVRQPIEEMCRLAYEFLVGQMEDPDVPPRRQVLRPELVIRESSRT